jgi:GNAT superfamily N-acetyltransferase
MTPAVTVRTAGPADAEALLRLMGELARFEGYGAHFKVTTADLLSRGLAAAGPAQFTAFVAQRTDEELIGYAVVVETPFTFDLRPTLTLKELYVRETARGTGAGSALFERVRAHGRERGAGRLKWDVLPGNEPAKSFYRRLGGAPDHDWERWIVPIDW